jgi:hypothetical protein
VTNADLPIRASAANLMRLREGLGLAQTDMGRLLHVTSQTICRWEIGHRRINAWAWEVVLIEAGQHPRYVLASQPEALERDDLTIDDTSVLREALAEILGCKVHDIRRKAPEAEHGRWFSITVRAEVLERARAALAATREPTIPEASIQYSDELTARAPGEKAAYLEGIEEGKRRAHRDGASAPAVPTIPAEGQAPEDVLDAFRALEIAREALQANHQWHKDYDDHDGYEDSELYEHNLAAFSCIDATLRSRPTGAASERGTTQRDEDVAAWANQIADILRKHAPPWNDHETGWQERYLANQDRIMEVALELARLPGTVVTSACAAPIPASQQEARQELTDDEFDRLQEEYDCCGIDARLRDFADACFEAGRLTRQPAQGDIE